MSHRRVRDAADRLGCLAVTAVLALGSMCGAAGAGDRWVGCYMRAYAGAHLAAHPGQSVAGLTLRLASIDSGSTEPGAYVYSASLAATFRGRQARLFADGDCSARDEGLRCVIDDDGGSYQLTRSGDGVALQIRTSLHMRKATQERTTVAIKESNREDQTFVLAPAPTQTCARDLEELEPSR